MLATWAYAALVFLMFLLMMSLAERWWPATLILFMPRWALLIPLAGLAVAVRWSGRRVLWAVQAATALLVLGPFMGLSLPLGNLFGPKPQGPRVRIVTLNRGLVRIDAERLRRVIEQENIDVVCFQEARADPAVDHLFGPAWHRTASGTIASRFPILAELPAGTEGFGEYGFSRVRVERAKIRLPDGREALVASVHMPAMRKAAGLLRRGDLDALKRYIEWRWHQSSVLLTALTETRDLPLLAAGDFNMPAGSPMRSLFKQEFRVGFEQAGWGYGYTRPTALPWLAIDHILASREWRFTGCRVGPAVGSDHLPMIAEVVLETSPARSRH
jgi:endonuclease/exonuclease/phosphatase family metal-dependent hydrolase